MATGDFAVSDNFGGSPYAWLFWASFMVLTYTSLLIILNFVIAIMGATFERVQGEGNCHISRNRLRVILSTWFRIPDSYKEKFSSAKYLISIEVDPDVDNVKDENSETRLTD